MPQNQVVPATGVGSVTAADTSIVVGGTAVAPTVATGTLDVIAADHPPAADWSNNAKKITALANGSLATDAAAFGQLASAGPITSVFGRTGVVVATTNDYTDAQVSNSPTNKLSATGDLLIASAANTLARLAVGTAGQRVVPIGGLPAWRTAATDSGTPANPAGTTSASLVMAGLARSVTPATTGNVLFAISGTAADTVIANINYALFTGTGGAPANGAAATGTQRTGTRTVTIAGAGYSADFAVSFLVLGLTLGTAVWYDLGFATSAGTVTAASICVAAVEQ